MRIFKNRMFNKWADKIKLENESLLLAAYEIAAGKYEASLGKKIFKKRIGIGDTGKNGGVRTIVAIKQGDNMFFIYGFAKGKRSNITPADVEGLQALAQVYFGYSDIQLNEAVKAGVLIEIEKELDGNG
jgi:hypothetical protein